MDEETVYIFMNEKYLSPIKEIKPQRIVRHLND